ncbi:hypothetical protein JCM18904_2041 [Vibrio sp. JCM 18904]|nr:hypothetical protein JCM18904_2041 [Vibrio sp. JCM 18904]
MYNLIVLLHSKVFRSTSFQKKVWPKNKEFVRAIDKLLKSKSIALLVSTDLVINRGGCSF